MRVVFFCEYGNMHEIGFGHLYRVRTLISELERRGHTAEISDDCTDADVFVVDHIFSQRDLLLKAKGLGIKTVLIDGTPEDAGIADVSTSVFYNYAAKYKGLLYAVFPLPRGFYFYDTDHNAQSDKIFVSMGGFDSNKYTSLAVRAALDMGFKAVVPKNNNSALDQQYPNVIVFDGDDYYEAMIDCFAAVTNGGLSMFQTIYFGVPTIPLAQYEHQKKNIIGVEHFCVPSQPDVVSIKSKIGLLIESTHMRRDLNYVACRSIDNLGPRRVADLIADK